MTAVSLLAVPSSKNIGNLTITANTTAWFNAGAHIRFFYCWPGSQYLPTTPACKDGEATNSLPWYFITILMSPDKDLHNKTFNLRLISDYVWSGYNTSEINSAMFSSWSFERFTWNQLVCCLTFTTSSHTYYPCLNVLLGLARRAADSSRVWFGDSLSRRGRDTKQGPWLPGQARPCQLHRGLQCSRALGRGRLAPDQLPQWILFLSLAFSYRKAEQRWRLLLNPVGLSCHCGSAALPNCFSTDTKWHSFANICASCPLPTSKTEAEKVTLIRFHCKKKKNTGCIIKITLHVYVCILH